MPELIPNPKATALLAMDFQTGIFGGLVGETDAMLGRVATLLDAARGAGALVIYVVVGFRPGFPEIGDRNKPFGGIKRSGRFAAGDPANAIHAAIAPKDGDVVVTKHRASAFPGTDLDMILRANGIETVILTGIITSGVVLSTLVNAADGDYRPIVVADCVADRDPEVHRVLVEKVFPRLAEVVRTEDVLAGFRT